MKVRAVLLDAAGTLFHTRGSVGEIYGSVARAYGSTASTNDIESAFLAQFRHSGPLSSATEKAWWKDVVHRVFSEVGMVRDFDAFFESVYDKFRDSAGWVLFPETIEVLENLKSQGLKLGLISNFDSRVYSVMGALGILHYFDTVTISSETGFAKPHPKIFEAAARSLDTAPSEILLVGDSLADDVEAAEREGLRAVLVDRENRHAGATHVRRISDLREIASLLDEVDELE
jgi:putative hydrolase of the HAD superfamily